MSRPVGVALTVTLSDEQLEALAELVAKKLLASEPGDTYDQERPPPGMSRRTFLNAARAGRFPTRKVGRKIVASKADVDAWHATLPSARTEAGAKGRREEVPDAPDNDVEPLDPELARLAELNQRKRR